MRRPRLKCSRLVNLVEFQYVEFPGHIVYVCIFIKPRLLFDLYNCDNPVFN